MSVAIAVKVSEGLVLGADSAATIQGQIQRPQGIEQGVLKTYFNARKLLQVGDFPIGVLTWGTAFIGPRTVESLVRQWEYEQHWQSQKEHQSEHKEDYQVRKSAERLCKHLSLVYLEEYGDRPEQERPVLGLIVAGYSQKGFFPEIWRFVFPFDTHGEVHDQRPDQDGKPSFGASWFGLTDAIVRLHFGRDEQAVGILSEKYGVPPEEIAGLLRPLEYQVPFSVMPMQDAIEYAYYMLNVTIGRYRFVVGPELCGGQAEIAAITQKQFTWITRKTWSLD